MLVVRPVKAVMRDCVWHDKKEIQRVIMQTVNICVERDGRFMAQSILSHSALFDDATNIHAHE